MNLPASFTLDFLDFQLAEFDIKLSLSRYHSFTLIHQVTRLSVVLTRDFIIDFKGPIAWDLCAMHFSEMFTLKVFKFSVEVLLSKSSGIVSFTTISVVCPVPH